MNETNYQELVKKRKIFENQNWMDIQYFKHVFPQQFDIKKVDHFLTFNMIQIGNEYVETGITKPAEKGKKHVFIRQDISC